MSEDGLPDLPCSKSQLGKLGDRLAAGSEAPDDQALFAAAMLVFDAHRSHLQQLVTDLDFSTALGRPVDVAVSGRTKSIDTLLGKLRSKHGLKLASIRDIAGIRLVAPMTLSEQDRVVELLVAHVSELGGSTSTVDRRKVPIGGYRAVHVIATLKSISVEIQVRTKIQAAWADMYEKFADVFGRQLRYFNSDRLEQLSIAAGTLAAIPDDRTTRAPADPHLGDAVKALRTILNLASRLQDISTRRLASFENEQASSSAASEYLTQGATVTSDVADVLESLDTLQDAATAYRNTINTLLIQVAQSERKLS